MEIETSQPIWLLRLLIGGCLYWAVYVCLKKIRRKKETTTAAQATQPASDLEEAKRIYMKYGCNTYHLWHDEGDDAYNAYTQLGVTPDHEAAWRDEYIQQKIAQMACQGMSLRLGCALTTASAAEALPQLLGRISKGDSYEQLWCANTIIDLIDGKRMERAMMKTSEEDADNEAFLPDETPDLNTCIATLKELTRGPITLTDDHREEIKNWPLPSPKTTEEDYIRDHARSKLQQVEKLVGA